MRLIKRFGALSFVVAVSTCLIAGCGGSGIEADSVADAQASYDRGVAAYQAEDYGRAGEEFRAALDAPGLGPDLVVDALLKHAVCLAQAGDYDAALRDLSEAEQGAAAMDQVHLARGLVLRLKGDSAQASAEFQEARRINPQVAIPK